MKHATNRDLIARILTGTDLPCRCGECLDRLDDLKSEQLRPARETGEMAHAFWTRQAAQLRERCERPAHRPYRMLAGVAAALLIVIAFGIHLIGPRPASRSTNLTEAQQERILEEIETTLATPLLGDMEPLVERTLSQEKQSGVMSSIQGGTNEA